MAQESSHLSEVFEGEARMDFIRQHVVPTINRFTACGNPPEDRLRALGMIDKVSIIMDQESEQLLSIWSRVLDDSDQEVRAAALERLDVAIMPDQIKHWIRSDAEEREFLRNTPPTLAKRAGTYLQRLGLASVSFFLKDPEA